MPTYTDNYNFKKPLGTDSALIQDLNDNFDDIDTALTPVIVDTTPPTNLSTQGKLETVIGWFANRFKAIIGKNNWYDTPTTNLESAAAHIQAGGAVAHPNATSSVSGFMSSADKQKLDSSTPTATANSMMSRDGSGRAKVATPSATQDIANKGYVDSTVSGGITAHKAEQQAHPNASNNAPGFMSAADKAKLDGATDAVSTYALMRRNAGGRAKVATPLEEQDITNKKYVDDKIHNNFRFGTYFGDDEHYRYIDLGFIPSIVYVQHVNTYNSNYNGVAITGHNAATTAAESIEITPENIAQYYNDVRVAISGQGFYVCEGTNSGTNSSTNLFVFFAQR